MNELSSKSIFYSINFAFLHHDVGDGDGEMTFIILGTNEKLDEIPPFSDTFTPKLRRDKNPNKNILNSLV